MRDKRFIEASFPVKEVSIESAKEKNIRHGHISTLHIWWARRPLASSRATNYAALIPEPKDDPETSSGRVIEWEKTRDFIIDLSKWETVSGRTGVSPVIEKARKDILKLNGGKPPRILDPFAGGGAIPLEALKLGCETYASDYNPVSILILKATLEYPQKYGKSKKRKVKSPINPPLVKGEGGFLGIETEEEYNPLLEDVRKWGNWVLEEAKKEIGKFYPKEKDGSIPVGYIWARTIPCQNPSCGAEIPLMRQFWLAKKDNKKIALMPYIKDGKVEFKVVGQDKSIPHDFDPSKGTISRAVATCLICGGVIDDNTTKTLFQREKGGHRMVAVVLHKSGLSGKKYRVATLEDERVLKDVERYLEEKREKMMDEWGFDPVPDEFINPINPDEELYGTRCIKYNVKTFGDFFNTRQKLALITFAEKVRTLRNKIFNQDLTEEYSRALMCYLSFGINRIASFSSILCRWKNGTEQNIAVFSGRNSLPMVFDYFEVNTIGNISTSWSNSLETIVEPLENIFKYGTPAIINQSSAASLPFPENHFDAVFTDPPYYDNINYAELSDFFYVWLKRTVGDLYPELFSTPLTPKTKEIVANPVRQGDANKAREFFEKNLNKAFKEIHRVLKQDGITTIVYAHKSTSGWESLINSLLESGLVITASYPIHTEMKARLTAKETASLASSIYIVARKMKRQETGWYNDVKEDMKTHIYEKLERLWNEGISGGDFFIAGIGSAIEIFGKYERVMDFEGNIIRADKLLEYVRQIVTDYAVRQILHNGIAGELSHLTRFYLLYRWTYQEAKVHFDDARKIAQSTGVDLEKEWNKGFIKKEKEFIRCVGPQDRELKEFDEPKELVNVLHMVLILWAKGESDKMKKVLALSGFGTKDAFYRVAQAVSETLPNESKEKKLLDGFLTGRDKIISEVKNVIVQLKLFPD